MGTPASGKVGARQKEAEEFRRAATLGVVSLFGCAAVATGHGHWLKEPAEVQPIVGPLVAMIEGMPKKQLEALKRYLNPAMFALGCATVAGPDIAQEIRLRQQRGGQRVPERARVEGIRVVGGGQGHANGADQAMVAPPADLVGNDL